MPKLVLYMTAGCHLCEEALALLLSAGLSVQEVDIAADPRFLEDYGVRIPVLVRTDTGAELGWPFGADALARFLGG